MGVRKAIFVVCAILLVFSVEAFGSFDTALRDLAQGIAQDFPPLEGHLLAVRGNWGMVDLGRNKGVFPGMVFTVFRQGKPFYHPITGALLGYTEDDLGVFQVVKAYPEASMGILKVKEEARPGDGVRITAARVNLYLFPLIDETGEGFNLMAFTRRLRTYLGETNRFNVYGEERVILAISSASEKGYLDALEKLREDPKVHGAVLMGSILKVKGDYYFRGDLISLDTGKRIDAFYVMLGKGGWRPMIERGLVFASPNWLDEGVGLGVGDVDGDGRPEILVAFKDRLDMYRLDVRASTMKLISSFPLKARTRLLSLDVVDINGDKKAEVILSLADETLFALRSAILSFDPQKRQWHYVVRGKEMLIRGYDVAGEGVLLTQSISKENPLAYAPRLARFVKGKLKSGRKLTGLKGDIICGAQLIDLNNNGALGVLVNEQGRVVLKNPLKGDILWDTGGMYGNWGRAFFFREPVAKSFYMGHEFIEEKDYIQYADDVLSVPGRSLVFKDSGRVKLALFTNKPNTWGVHFSPYKSTVIRLYQWRGSYFEDTGWVKRLRGGVVDLQAADVNGDGHKEMLVLIKHGHKTREGGERCYTRLLVYRIGR